MKFSIGQIYLYLLVTILGVHFGFYFGVTGNGRAVRRFYNEAIESAYKWLNRRGGKKNSFSWETLKVLAYRIVQLYNLCMKVIADTNIFLSVALEEKSKSKIVSLTQGCDIYAPEILPYEIGNAISAMVKRKQIHSSDAVSIFSITQKIPVKLIKVDIPKALSIATDKNIYAYDAYFIQSALSSSCSILSLDQKMIEVSRSMNIQILEES